LTFTFTTPPPPPTQPPTPTTPTTTPTHTHTHQHTHTHTNTPTHTTPNTPARCSPFPSIIASSNSQKKDRGRERADMSIIQSLERDGVSMKEQPLNPFFTLTEREKER